MLAGRWNAYCLGAVRLVSICLPISSSAQVITSKTKPFIATASSHHRPLIWGVLTLPSPCSDPKRLFNVVCYIFQNQHMLHRRLLLSTSGKWCKCLLWLYRRQQSSAATNCSEGRIDDATRCHLVNTGQLRKFQFGEAIVHTALSRDQPTHTHQLLMTSDGLKRSFNVDVRYH